MPHKKKKFIDFAINDICTIDFEKEKARLAAEQKKLEDEISRIEKKLSNQGFVSKAPAAVVEGEKAKMEKYRENLAGVVAALAKLG